LLGLAAMRTFSGHGHRRVAVLRSIGHRLIVVEPAAIVVVDAASRRTTRLSGFPYAPDFGKAEESYFVKFKDEFNAGHTGSDTLQTQSNWQVLHPSTWGNNATAPNLVTWLNTNKGEAWAMIYGSLPHP
jgi:hypothetical protein